MNFLLTDQNRRWTNTIRTLLLPLWFFLQRKGILHKQTLMTDLFTLLIYYIFWFFNITTHLIRSTSLNQFAWISLTKCLWMEFSCFNIKNSSLLRYIHSSNHKVLLWVSFRLWSFLKLYSSNFMMFRDM